MAKPRSRTSRTHRFIRQHSLSIASASILAKYLYEKGSSESRRPPRTLLGPVWERLRDHSLSIFLVITGIGWVVLYASMDSEAKWGQVVGNIASEWTQVFGLVLLTKQLIERHSKQSS